MSMESNIREVSARFAAVSDRLEDTATMRSINRAVDAVATQSNREIRKIYRVKASGVSRALTKRRASKKQAVLSGEVVFSGRRLRLVDFAARQTKAGVTVQVKADSARKLLRGTFLATMPSGHRAVWKRLGKRRLPIEELKTIAIPQMAGNKTVMLAMRRVANDVFRRNFTQQLNYLTRR